MPYLNIITNQSIADESSFLKTVSQAVAKASSKPESYVMVSVKSDSSILMGGSDAPVAFLDYRALGLPDDRAAFSDTLCSVINDQLSIAGNRIYISMTDSERHNWGWDHGTF